LFDLCADRDAAPFIKGLVPSISNISEPGTKTAIESLDFESVVEHLQTTELFQYTGSLTTPPCTEGITFLITKEPLPIDIESYNAIKSVVKFNSRYTQNALGEENMIAVAGRAGTAEQELPSNATTTPAAASVAGPTKGAQVSVTEMSGTPLPTGIKGVVV
jgi:hypothetical protein